MNRTGYLLNTRPVFYSRVTCLQVLHGSVAHYRVWQADARIVGEHGGGDVIDDGKIAFAQRNVMLHPPCRIPQQRLDLV